MPSRRRAYAVSAAVAVAIFAACTAKAPPPDAGLATAAAGAPDAGHAGSGAHGEVLACLSSFIPQKCAVTGCHDDQSRAYGMDLSSGDSIFASWVNRKGLDNCGSQLVPRVVPGQPDASFVFRKVTSQLTCVGTVSQPMPPPPAAALSADEIEMVRAWILAGAPMHCKAGELPASGGASGVGGGTSLDLGGTSGVGGGDASSSGMSGTGGAAIVPDNPFICSATMPCTSQLICSADNCSTKVWDCVTHRPPQEAAESSLPDGYQPHHPCPKETMDFCGCDGVTFVAPVTCPDRPYQHPGRCDDGYNCNPQDILCAASAPTCGAGEAPSVVDECYANCVLGTACRCEFNWECPTGWQCDRTQWRCVTPPPAGGL